MRRLLTHLAQFSVFSRQGEVLCTRGLEYLLQDKIASEAFANLVGCPADLRHDLRWRAEALAPDKTRPDLEASAANSQSKPVPVVKVEAKLGAAIDEKQLEAYGRDLKARTGRGVLVLLVPRDRTGEAKEVIRNAEIPHEVQKVVCSWEDALECLRQANSEPLAGDLAQFEAMYRVLCGDDIEPLANEDAIRAWREREGSFIAYVDRATRELSKTTKLLPLALDSKKKRVDRDEPEDINGRVAHSDVEDSRARIPKGGYLRRYVLCFEQESTKSYFSIGVRDPFESYVTPVWLRFHSVTGAFSKICERLRKSHTPPKMVECEKGHVWIPLDVKPESDVQTVVAEIVEQATKISNIARGA